MRKDSDSPLRVRSRFVTPRPDNTDLVVSFLSDGSVQVTDGPGADGFYERRKFDEDGAWIRLPYAEPLEPT